MRRLIFVNRFFYPDHSATSQILSDLAFHLAGTGRDIHVLTSQQIYDDPRATLPTEEVVNGVHVHRLASTRFGRNTLPGRSIDYLSFYRSVRNHLMDLAGPGDLIISKTDPPLISIIAIDVARRKGAGLVNWLQDLYPELAVALRVPFLRGPVVPWLIRHRDRSLLGAEANVAVGELMGRQLARQGVQADRIHVIPNWCDDREIVPTEKSTNPLLPAWGLADKFVVGYSGNLGRVHEIETVLTTARLLHATPRLVFLMIGGGKRFNELKTAVEAQGLRERFCFMPYQPRSQLVHSLGVADIHWLSLNPKLEGFIVPSKVYGIAAAGKPIIAIGDKNGELATLVHENECGVVIPSGNSAELMTTLLRLMHYPQAIALMGARARQMLDSQFSRQRAFERWMTLFATLDKGPPLDGLAPSGVATTVQ